jgi:hypothetical protein
VPAVNIPRLGKKASSPAANRQPTWRDFMVSASLRCHASSPRTSPIGLDVRRGRPRPKPAGWPATCGRSSSG